MMETERTIWIVFGISWALGSYMLGAWLAPVKWMRRAYVGLFIGSAVMFWWSCGQGPTRSILLACVAASFAGAEGLLWVYKAIRRHSHAREKLLRTLATVCITEEAEVTDVVCKLDPEEEIGYQYKFHADYPPKYYYVVRLTAYNDIYDRVGAETVRILESVGLPHLGPSRPGYHCYSKREYFHLHNRNSCDRNLVPYVDYEYFCEISMAEYDAFNGTPRPVTVDVFPYCGPSEFALNKERTISRDCLHE